MAVNRLSPGVDINEKIEDLTVSSATALNGAFCAPFNWGPVGEPVLQDSEDSYRETFGDPTDKNASHWFNGAQFLAEAGGLYTVRLAAKDAYNAIVGGAGSGFTVDVSAVNGEVASIAINNEGSGYSAGDIVEIATGLTRAEIRILSTGALGDVTGVALLSNGTGYLTASNVATIVRKDFSVGNDDEFESGEVELPEILAKFPGSRGNNLGLTIVRASEFYGNMFEDRFMRAPAATELAYDGNGIVDSFQLPSSAIADPNLVVTINNVTIPKGIAPGTYSLTGTTLNIEGDSEDFNGTGTTSKFTIVNPYELDLFSSVVTVNGVTLRPEFNGTGHVQHGSFDIDPETGVLTIGTNIRTLNGDGVTSIFQITTTDVLDTDNTVVRVDGEDFTVVDTIPDVGEVSISPITGGYSFTFNVTEIPRVGLNNIEIEDGFPAAGVSNVKVVYGLPNGVDSLRVFHNQTEVHAIVFDRTGEITGSENAVLELYESLSLIPNTMNEDGTAAFYVQSINDRSRFVRLSKTVTHFTNHLLGNGTDGSNLTSADYQEGYKLFENRENYDVMYLIDPVIDSSLAIYIASIAENRGDCAAFIGTPMSATVNNVGNELRDSLRYHQTLRASSYMIPNPIWQRVYDRYNDKHRWIPLTGNDAGLYAKTHRENNLWTTAAGYNRGQYRRALKLSWLPNETQRNTLYANYINFAVRDRTAGYYLFGQKTNIQKNVSLNRANTRFLSIFIKRGLREALKYILFELNDEITRAAVRNKVNPFMRDVKSGRGVYEFKFKCDSDNNTSEVIDNNELVAALGLKPTKTSEFIGLNLVFTKTGVAFEEVGL